MARGARDGVVDTIRRQIRQATSVAIRGGGRPESIEDSRLPLGFHQKDSAERQTESEKLSALERTDCCAPIFRHPRRISPESERALPSGQRLGLCARRDPPRISRGTTASARV